jgi:N-acetylmuramic acid 6-phosphate etherase
MFIDRLTTREAVKLFTQEDQAIIKAIEAANEPISQTIDLCVASLKKGGRIIYSGAGTSGRLGILDASECPPTFGVSPDLVIGIIAGGMKAVTDAIEGAEDNFQAGKKALQELEFCSNDILIGITASGTTPFVSGGIEYAKEIGANTVLLTCNPYGELPKTDVLINPVVGPEVITGSTRLKSGTACKMVLNMISSISMIKMGKVYENLMVDVKASNKKLEKRALRIVMEGAGIPNYEAEAYLQDANGETKVAILMAKKGVSAEEARARLQEADGVLYKALKESDYA